MATADATSQSLTQSKVAALYRQAPAANLTIVVITAVFCLLLVNRVDRVSLAIWALLMLATASFRLFSWLQYRRGPAGRSPQSWLHQYTLGCALVGLSWGLAQPLFADPADTIVTVSLFMLLFGVMSSAVAILSAHLPAFLVYVLPQVALYMLALGEYGTLPGVTLSLAVLFYFLMLSAFARNDYRRFLGTQQLTEENQQLIARLDRENNEREMTIQQRTRELQGLNASLQREVGERERAEAELREEKTVLARMAHHDELTGLPNRTLLNDRLSHAILRANRDPAQFALLFIDMDHFKEINDSLGHSKGDELLQAAASRLLESVRKGDTVARLGGDEFVVLAEQLDNYSGVDGLASKILTLFKSPFTIDGRTLNISASVGVSLFPDNGGDAETLLRNADSAMYRAKQEGRNTYAYYSPEMTEKARSRITLESDLRLALQHSQFELYYQPQFELGSRKIIGAEALLRWHHPERGLVMPDAFISVAEESDLINDIGLWVLDTACRQLKSWEGTAMQGYQLAVNLSGRQIWHNPLLETIESALAASGCKPGLLEVEITEGFLVQEPEAATTLLRAMRERGISVSIDDFGTGYSSLSYLKHYPLSKLKIDKSFVSDTPTNQDDCAIVRAIVALGHSLGLAVIAEGVETESQARFLEAEGCDQAQGYLFAKALPLGDFERFVSERQQRLGLAQ